MERLEHLWSIDYVDGLERLWGFDFTEQEQGNMPLVHGRMLYCCETCGKRWFMYLEKGIEEFGENHKPSPFTIVCPHCGGWARDVSGIQKVPGGGYVPLREGHSYFANLEDRECGVPVFPEEKPKIENGWKATEVDELRKELEWAAEITKRAVQEEVEKIENLCLIVAEKTGRSFEEIIWEILRALGRFEGDGEKKLTKLPRNPDGAIAIEPGEFLDVKTAWDRKEAREKLGVAERVIVSRFRQHKARENTWRTKKRTGKRRREWRGPWKDN